MKKTLILLIMILIAKHSFSQQSFVLNKAEYFEKEGVNVMAYQDIYPEGHQGGVAVIMHGKRLATNGDIRLDETPGQWQPIPKQIDRKVDAVGNMITVTLAYPDEKINRKGFNPIEYPDLNLNYTVNVKAHGQSIVVTVDLDKAVPKEFLGKAGFNMELFPGWLFGKTWSLGGKSGIFPRQANGPVMKESKGTIVSNQPFATGKKLVVAPEDDYMRMSIESKTGDIQLLDGKPESWGIFLRYNYLKFNFSQVRQEGMYYVKYSNQQSQPFRIAPDVYKRDVWQPVVEFFLPVQMCHMRINEKYRVWHGLCHMDDALMAPVNHNHFDGYIQGESTLTSFNPREHVPGLNVGGWHDAGDYDLRVESQSGEAYILRTPLQGYHSI